MHIKRILAVVFGAVAISASAWAQSTNRIAGVVRDETGGPIRGAIVRAETGGTTTASPTALTAATDDRGRFIFVVARSGDWRLTFEAPGFETTTVTASVRLSGAAPNLDIKLDRREAPEAFGVMAGIDSKALSLQLASAAALFDEGKYDQAITAYREIKVKTPALTLVNLQLGNAFLMKKSYAEAESAFQEVLKSNAEDPNGLFAMGRLKEAQGNNAEASSWYQKASTSDALWTRPLMRLAALARQSGDATSAAKYLAKVIEVAPGSADAVQAAAMQKQ
jgi:tetratricopeptide (TPR) repeat protein